MADAKTKGRSGRRKVKKNVPFGQAHIKASFNNTIVTITDPDGNVIVWESAGSAGYKGSRKGPKKMSVAGKRKAPTAK